MDLNQAMGNFRSIIDLEFKKELKDRQNQLDTIEKSIFNARKMLHMLRYVIITSYYKNSEVEENDNERLHPALKNILGLDENELNNISTRPKASIESDSKDEHINHIQNSESTIEVDVIESLNNLTDIDSSQLEISRNRIKVKKRIIIGNISKYIPPDSKEDQTTHKWMVYVRTPDNSSDISNFIKQVIFYLHPSYKPNDVIEVRDPPFHLTRRGWGEFPLRIRLYFKLEINKPVDVVHNLKLDKSFSGRQTFGGETIIDLSIFEKQSPDMFVGKIYEFNNTHEADSYSESDLKNNGDNYVKRAVLLDHSYSLDPELLNTSEFIDNSDYNITECSDLNKYVSNFDSLKEIKQFQLNLPLTKFKNVCEALPYLFKKIPIITDLAENEDLKTIYPFVCKSSTEYLSWNIGKRASCEWSRAKTVYNILIQSHLPDINTWDVKSIILYARSHGFTPFPNLNIFQNTHNVWKLKNCIAFSYIRNEQSLIPDITTKNDHFVDVENEETVIEDSNSDQEKICLKDEFEIEYSYIRQAALDVGIIFKVQEIIPNVLFNSVERMLLEVFKYMAEDIIRRAKALEVMQGRFMEPTDISISSVQTALQQRPEFKKILESKQKFSKY